MQARQADYLGSLEAGPPTLGHELVGALGSRNEHDGRVSLSASRVRQQRGQVLAAVTVVHHQAQYLGQIVDQLSGQLDRFGGDQHREILLRQRARHLAHQPRLPTSAGARNDHDAGLGSRQHL